MSEPEEEKTFFVSRRGHQVGLNQVDLGGIDIDSDQDTTQPPKQSKRSKQINDKEVKTVNQAKKPSSRKKIIITLLVIFLLALPLLAGEIVAAQYRNGVTSAKDQLRTLTTETVLPLQKESSVTADQMQSVARDVDKIVGSMCRGGLLDNMASLYPRAKEGLKSCKSAQESYASLTSGLYDLEAQTRYLEKIGVLMKSVATPITDEYAVIGAQQTAWLAAAEGLEKVSPPAAMNAAHEELQKHVVAVADHWSKLNTANNSKDAAGFTQAEKDLATEYEAVRTAGAKFTTTLTSTQQLITTRYNFLK